jgi:dTDP-4-amino-4,6-dideoxygalactose transaminase
MGSFRGTVSPDGYKVSKLLSQTCLNLPLYPALTDSEQDYVVAQVREFFGEK